MIHPPHLPRYSLDREHQAAHTAYWALARACPESYLLPRLHKELLDLERAVYPDGPWTLLTELDAVSVRISAVVALLFLAVLGLAL